MVYKYALLDKNNNIIKFVKTEFKDAEEILELLVKDSKAIFIRLENK